MRSAPNIRAAFFLRFGRGALVDQQVAQLHVRIAQVVAEDVLAEMPEEKLSRGRLAVELAALVARAVEGDGGLAVVRHQSAEERRQQAHAVRITLATTCLA